MSKLGGYMTWVPVMLKSTVARRKEWIDSIMEAFRSMRPAKSDESVRYLSDVLSEGKEFHLVGFVPKIEYIKADGPEKHLGVIFEHQHMNPALLYKHNELPVFILTSPGFDWDKERGISG